MEANRFRFRVWDKFDNIMRYPEWLEENGFALGVDGRMVKWLPDCLCLRDHNMFPMQSTGLTDKNGKEIFEGDILQGVEQTVVEWENGYSGYSGCMWSHNQKIIGNIYSNPELLNGRKGEVE